MGFDLGRGEIRGEPFLVEPDASEASIARDGTLLFVMNPRRSNERMVVRVGFDGAQREVITAAHAGPMDFQLSPDGDRIAFAALPVDGGDNTQLWVRDLARGAESQITSYEDRFVLEPTWSPDGEEIYFIAPSIRGGGASTMVVPADGSRPASVAFEDPCFPTPDGEFILSLTLPGGRPLQMANPDTTEIWLWPAGEPDARRVVLGGDAPYYPGGLSPDGEYFLYARGRSGSFSIYLTRFPEFTGRWKISLDGDVEMEAFAPDGSAIFYAVDDELFRVSLEAGPTPVLGRPERVGTLPPSAGDDLAIHPDGESYLINVGEGLPGDGERGRRGLKIAMNWSARIRAR